VRSTLEIERKYIVRSLPEGYETHDREYIQQGYMPSGALEKRLREAVADGTPTYVLTTKRGHGLVREEKEVVLGEAQYRKLWALTEGHRLSKIRYSIPYNYTSQGGMRDTVLIYLDKYCDSLSCLQTAEVEFKSLEHSGGFVPPPWFGKEVTADPAYSNRMLATAGLPDYHPQCGST